MKNVQFVKQNFIGRRKSNIIHPQLNRTLENNIWHSKGRKSHSRKALQQLMKGKEIPNDSWFKFSKPLFYFFCMITLLKILIACFTTSFHILLSLLTYTSCISWLKDNIIGKFRFEQFTIYACLHPT